jgi:hypothetical protein
MSRTPFDPCTLAVERYKSIARWRNLWTILLFIFGMTVILFLCASILLFNSQGWLPGAISALGTIVNGVGVSWVVARRNDAVREEGLAYEDVKKAVRESMASTHATAPTPGAGGSVLQELEDFRRKQLLFGLFR